MGKSRSGMNIPDLFSESFDTVFGLKILNFFDAGPDTGSEIFTILDPGRKIRILDLS